MVYLNMHSHLAFVSLLAILCTYVKSSSRYFKKKDCNKEFALPSDSTNCEADPRIGYYYDTKTSECKSVTYQPCFNKRVRNLFPSINKCLEVAKPLCTVDLDTVKYTGSQQRIIDFFTGKEDFERQYIEKVISSPDGRGLRLSEFKLSSD